MTKKTFTEIAYEKIEQTEQKRKWLRPITLACFVFASAGLVADAMVFMIFSHQKGDSSYINMGIIVIVAVISVALFVAGINRYILIKKWRNQIKQLETLEETIYLEVLKHKID